MEAREIKLVLIVVLILAIIASVVGPYNSMVQLRNKVYEQKGQIENVLQARADKIPALIASVKDYVKHEEKVFETVSEARDALKSAVKSGDLEKMTEANDRLSISLNAVKEAYPELKSSQLYQSLNDEISGSVNRIAQERRQYNIAVTEYNNKLQTYPNVLFAQMLGFTPEKYFEASEEAHGNNLIDFGD